MVLSLFSQSTKWQFGKYAALDFTPAGPVAHRGFLNTSEGCASVCNQSGEIIFSTDGVNVYNQFGVEVYSNLQGASSSTHSALIVPHPANPCSRFLVFTAPPSDINHPFHDVYVNDFKIANGDIKLSSSRRLLKSATEKLAATPDGKGGYWVVAHDYTDTVRPASSAGRRYFSYHITTNTSTVNLIPVISYSSNYHGGQSPWGGNYWNSLGQMKFNSNGKILASVIYTDGIVELMHFDKQNGKLTELLTLDQFCKEYPERSLYGIEFSASGHFMYLSTAYVSVGFTGLLLGFDIRHLNAGSIWQSRRIIAEKPSLDEQRYPFGALQIGPDNQIYVALPFSRFLGTLDGDNFSSSRIFTDSAIALTDTCLIGFPTLVKVPDCSYGIDRCAYLNFSLGKDTAICSKDSIQLGVDYGTGVEYNWNNGSQQAFIYGKAGNEYRLSIRDSNGCKYSSGINVLRSPLAADVNFPTDTILCEDSPVLEFKDEELHFAWADGTTTSFHRVLHNDLLDVNVYSGCDSANFTISVILEDCRCKVFVPSAFTPSNYDGLNDVYQLKAACELESYHLIIYSRWGEKVFESNDISQSWNGEVKHSSRKTDTYVYKLFYKAPAQREMYKEGLLTVVN